MSMKRAEWPGRFPMQDEHETGKNGVGMARPGASADVECREPKPGTDPGVPQVESTDRVCRMRTKREVRLGGRSAGSTELCQVEQGPTRRGAGLPGESDRVERVADDAIDPRIPRPGGSEGGAVPTSPLQGAVHRR